MTHYNAATRQLFFAPQHVGSMLHDMPWISVSSLAARMQKLTLTLGVDAIGWIRQARFQAMGEPYLIAGLEYLCQKLEHTPLAEHPQAIYQALIEVLQIPKTRYSVALLVESCYFNAIKQLKEQFKPIEDTHE